MRLHCREHGYMDEKTGPMAECPYCEIDRLTAEVARLKCGLWQTKDHRIGLLKESFENIVDNYSNFDCRRWRSMMSDIIKISKAALEI